MVVTRNGRRNERIQSNNTSKQTEHNTDTDQSIIKPKRKRQLTSYASCNEHVGISSGTGGMESVNLTSPVTSESPSEALERIIEGPDTRNVATRDGLSASVPQRRATAGSAQDPIELGDSPPRHKCVVKEITQNIPTPHKFRNRHCEPQVYQTDQFASAKTPASGLVFTGNKSQDIHRMMSAKTAAHGWKMPPAPPHAQFKVNHSNTRFAPAISSRTLDFNTRSFQHGSNGTSYAPQSAYSQYHARMGVSLSGNPQETLRKNASRRTTESLARSHTSGEIPVTLDQVYTLNINQGVLPAPVTQRPTWQLSSDADSRTNGFEDHNPHLNQIITQTSLLASLLQVYPTSADQEDLRFTISQLASNQAASIDAWLANEHGVFSKRRRSNTDSAISIGDDPPAVIARGVTSEENERIKAQNKQDGEVRKAMSAGADLWNDGSGVSLAEVFASEEALATPAAPEAEKEDQDALFVKVKVEDE